MSKYLFYDVETPNHRNDSICACAWILCDECEELSSGYQLINPKSDFDALNIRIHHIHEQDVVSSPTFSEYWRSTLSKVFSGATIVAHSAGFDLSATAKALSADGIDLPRIKYIDTVPVFRALLPGHSCKLADLAKYFCLTYQAHDAGADARMLYTVLDLLKEELEYPDFSALFQAANVVPSIPLSEAEMSLRKSSIESASLLLKTAREHCVDFSDVAFAFHGNMQCFPISREPDLSGIVTALGGTYQKNVSGKTDFYVRFDSEITGTVKKAFSIANSSGSTLQIIDESDFLDMLGYRTEKVDHESPNLVRVRKQKEREAALAIYEEKEQLKREKALKREMNRKDKSEKPNDSPKAMPKTRSVSQFSKDGVFLKTFQSLSLAAATMGCSTKVISDCANGKQKTASGYVWRYADFIDE